jgi:hypothetical protein
MEQVLEVLIHHIDHPVAKRPEKKERGNESEGDTVAFSLGGTEHVKKFGHRGMG